MCYADIDGDGRDIHGMPIPTQAQDDALTIEGMAAYIAHLETELAQARDGFPGDAPPPDGTGCLFFSENAGLHKGLYYHGSFFYSGGGSCPSVTRWWRLPRRPNSVIDHDTNKTDGRP